MITHIYTQNNVSSTAPCITIVAWCRATPAKVARCALDMQLVCLRGMRLVCHKLANICMARSNTFQPCYTFQHDLSKFHGPVVALSSSLGRVALLVVYIYTCQHRVSCCFLSCGVGQVGPKAMLRNKDDPRCRTVCQRMGNR